MCGTEACHEEKGEVPEDKVSLKTDKAWVRAGDENMSGHNAVPAMWAGGVVPSTQAELIRVVRMKGVASDELEAH